MRKLKIYLPLLLLSILVTALSIWGPEFTAVFRDRDILNVIHVQEVQDDGEGYRYSLTRNEKLYILSEALNSQAIPESEQNFKTREESSEAEYQQISGGYAFVVNRRGPSNQEIAEDKIYETCNRELGTLKELHILPPAVKNVSQDDYYAALYSAIDVLEPRNNVAVWRLSLLSRQKNNDRSNRLMDAYIDADDGKLYELYVRTELSWEDIDPDEIVKLWSQYLGLEQVTPYEASNPLMETTPFFKKYVCSGVGDGTTVITVGFYEGINELFIKISK